MSTLDANLPAGFLTALRTAAWRAGLRLRRQDSGMVPVKDVEQMVGSRTPRLPYGHPDVLVRHAVILGILDLIDEQP